VECLHAIGAIFVKDKCKLCVKLCASSLFMHFLWLLLVYGACVFPLLFYMNLCIFRVFVCFKFFIQFDKCFMWHSPIVGCWGCYNMVSEL
jgi:hypothetical protein